jgi:hypothetical protein
MSASRKFKRQVIVTNRKATERRNKSLRIKEQNRKVVAEEFAKRLAIAKARVEPAPTTQTIHAAEQNQSRELLEPKEVSS